MNEQDWELEDEQDVIEERLRERLKEAAKRAPAYLRLTANMIRDDDVPYKAKATLLVGGLYVVSPIDLVPGFIPVLGQLDDLIVLMIALRSAIELCPDELVEFHMIQAGLTEEDVERDQETAKLGAKWIGAKGWGAAKIVGMQGLRLGADMSARMRSGISSKLRER